MADIIQDIDEILDSFPDNNARDISAQQLRNYVVSISVFGSKSRSTTGAQTIDAVPTILQWDGVGVSRGVVDAVDELEIPVGGDGDYEVNLDLSVDTQNTRTYELIVAVNGSPVNTIGWIDGDGQIKNCSGSIVKNLAEGDTVAIWCESTGATSNFFIQIGSQFSIKRLL